MTELDAVIKKLEKEVADKSKELTKLKNLKELYPDLKQYVGRWNKVVYYSKQVNAQVDRYETRYNCGCCNDSPFELWPHLQTEFGEVYSDPPMFFIGKRSYNGVQMEAGWKEKLRKVGVSESFITQLQYSDGPDVVDESEKVHTEDELPPW